jgi:hypothetical protein
MYTLEELKEIYGDGYDLEEIRKLKNEIAKLHSCGYSIKELCSLSTLSGRTLRDFTWGRLKAQRKTIDLIRELVSKCELRSKDLVERFSIWEELSCIEAIKENITVTEEDGLLKLRCPLCKATNKRSFCLNRDEKVFYCHFCKKAGDVITLVSLVHNTNQFQAMRIIGYKIAQRDLGISNE